MINKCEIEINNLKTLSDNRIDTVISDIFIRYSQEKFSDLNTVLNTVDKFHKCQILISSLIEHQRQIEDWKKLHETIHNVSLDIIDLRESFSGKDYQKIIQSLEYDWTLDISFRITSYTDFTEVDKIIRNEQVKNEFEEENGKRNWNKKLSDLRKNINQLVDECPEPEDLKPRIESIKNFLFNLIKINKFVIFYLDGRLKSKIDDLKEDFEKIRIILGDYIDN